MYRLANDYADKIDPAFKNLIDAGDKFEKAMHQAAQDYQNSGLAVLESTTERMMVSGLGSAILLGCMVKVLMNIQPPKPNTKEVKSVGGLFAGAAVYSLGLGIQAWDTARQMAQQVMALLESHRVNVDEVMRDAKDEGGYGFHESS